MTNFNSKAVSSEVASRNGSNVNDKVKFLTALDSIKKTDGRSAMYKVTYYLYNKKHVVYLSSDADLDTLIACSSIVWPGFSLWGIAHKLGNGWQSYTGSSLEYYDSPKFVESYLLKADIESAINEFHDENTDYTCSIENTDGSYWVTLWNKEKYGIQYNCYGSDCCEIMVRSADDIHDMISDFKNFVDCDKFDDACDETEVGYYADTLNKMLNHGYDEYNTEANWKNNSRLNDDGWDADDYNELIKAIDDFGYAYNDTYAIAAKNIGVGSLTEDDCLFVMTPGSYWWYNENGTCVADRFADLVDIREYCVNKVNNMAC